MHKYFFRQVVLSLILALTLSAVWGARPMVTDDARVVDPDGCQIESFVKRQRDYSENEFWILPACNPGGHAELTLGGTRTENDALGRSSSTIAQAKFLLRPLDVNDYGSAVSVGAQNTRPFASNGPTRWNPYLNLIGSRSLLDDRMFVHVNLGGSVRIATPTLPPASGALPARLCSRRVSSALLRPTARVAKRQTAMSACGCGSSRTNSRPTLPMATSRATRPRNAGTRSG